MSTLLHACLATLAICALSPMALADDAAVERLKRSYLRCAEASTERRLRFDEVEACSETAERLLQRGFDGDFDRLLAWWRAARAAAQPASREAKLSR